MCRQLTVEVRVLTDAPLWCLMQEWIKSTREVLSSIEGDTGLHLSLEGGGATIYDAVGSVLKVHTPTGWKLAPLA